MQSKYRADNEQKCVYQISINGRQYRLCFREPFQSDLLLKKLEHPNVRHS